MSYGLAEYAGAAFAGPPIASAGDLPVDDQTHLAVEVSWSAGALETPVWVDITADVRWWDTLRGRNRELERMQPGRTTIVLGNRERQYDSSNPDGPYFGNLKPMRRLRIRETFIGVTYPVFDGFIDRILLDYPAKGKDATATIVATDAFKIWARTDLPLSVYADVVADDDPAIYWRLDEQKNYEEDAALAALNRGSLGPTGNGSYVGPPPLGGEQLVVKDPGTSMVPVNSIQTPGSRDMGVFIANADFNMLASSFAVEVWCVPEFEDISFTTVWEAFDAGPGGPTAASLERGADEFIFSRTTNAPNTLSVSSAGTEVNNKRYHVVCRHVFGEPLRMWVNGTLFTGSTSTGTFEQLADLRVGYPQSPSGGPGQGNFHGPIGHFAVYTGADAVAVDQAWVDRHYAAGTAPWQGDLPGVRIGRLLDAAVWPATWRELDAGAQTLQSAAIDGQTVLEHAHKTQETEFGLLFVSRAGDARFVARSAVFARAPGPTDLGDGPGEAGYRDIKFDDGDTVLRNRATISRLNGVARVDEDTASVDEYGRFDYTLDGLLHDSDTYSATYAAFVVDEYAEPRRRVTSLVIGTPPVGQEAAAYPAMLGVELGDVVTVLSRPLGGGDPFEQVCAIEGIQHTGEPGGDRTCRLILSPDYAGSF